VTLRHMPRAQRGNTVWCRQMQFVRDWDTAHTPPR
jgi:hypothetical protein